MDKTRRAKSPRRSSGRESALTAALLGLLSIFEVTFDVLSLVAALLGGIARDAGSAGNAQEATIAPGATTGLPLQPAVQNVAHGPPASRPVGITIISILLDLLGIFELGFGALALVTSLIGSFVVPLRSPAAGAALGAYYLLVGMVKLFFAWGLWRLQRWAFWATVFIAAVSLLSSVLAVTEPAPTVWAFLADLLIPAVILVYFAVDSDVRRAFRL
jgi:uncharacterized membrane protein (DUF2068 family)